MQFLVFSSPSFMNRTKVCIDSIEQFHPDSKIHLEMVDNPKTGAYVDGLPKRRIEKLIDLVEGTDEAVCLLGADCVLYGNIDSLEFKETLGVSIVLIPHIVHPPKKDGASFYQTGHVNADLIVATKKSLPILNWLVRQEMKSDIAHGYFYEQTWLSATPFLFNGVKILRRSQYNLAYFNVHERTVTKENGVYIVDDFPLKMVQFSGYVEGKPERMSKYNKYGDATGALLELFQDYEKRIKS